ncbi:hypothetical protein FF1_017499 [Malus domestica]|nr:AP2/ERF and B3 domain-containing transcription factor At1g50680-like [Malus domestica]
MMICTFSGLNSNPDFVVEAGGGKRKHKPFWVTARCQIWTEIHSSLISPYLNFSFIINYLFNDGTNFLLHVTNSFNCQIFLDSDLLPIFGKIFLLRFKEQQICCFRLFAAGYSSRSVMEEGMSRTISNVGVKRDVEEVCDPNLAANDSSDGASRHVSKRFKGVVEQPNGHWGAQIYANHERVWLGTFSSENEAAMAYDSAAIKLRGWECHRNFPWTKVTFEEPHFQNQYSKEAVLRMIKDSSYQAEFLEYRKSCAASKSLRSGIQFDSLVRVHSNGNAKMLNRLLFQKELTPSDVSKLNRLVIPVTNAKRCFPSISESISQKVESGSSQLVFYDKMMRSWTFRYCYWKSSRSFVFTRGWSRFVKTHHLKAKDILTFFQCHYKQLGDNGNKEPQTFYMVKVNWDGAESEDDNINCLVENDANNYQYDKCKLESVSQNINEAEGIRADQKKRFRLFGVEICNEVAH